MCSSQVMMDFLTDKIGDPYYYSKLCQGSVILVVMTKLNKIQHSYTYKTVILSNDCFLSKFLNKLKNSAITQHKVVTDCLHTTKPTSHLKYVVNCVVIKTIRYKQDVYRHVLSAQTETTYTDHQEDLSQLAKKLQKATHSVNNSTCL